MNVYILMGNSGKDEFDHVLGAYSTEEKATAAKSKKFYFGKPWRETYILVEEIDSEDK